MSVLLAPAVAAMAYGAYSGVRAIGMIFGAIRKLGASRRFSRLSPPEQIQAFLGTPSADPRFRRFTVSSFVSFAVAMALFGFALPMTAVGASAPRMPFFAMASVMALMAGLAAAGRGLPVGAFGWCEVCGCEMQLIGLGQHGGVFMERNEMMYGFGVAEQCRECGRLYCASCYPQRGRTCVCGQGKEEVRRERGAVYRGSLRLIKVRY